MKTLFIAALVVLGLHLFWSDISFSWYALHLDRLEFFEPFFEALIFGVIAVALMVFGFLLAISLVGALFLGFGVMVVAALFIGIHMLWPLLFLLLIIYLVVGGGKQTA